MIIKYLSELTKTISRVVRGNEENNDTVGKRGDDVLLAANGGAEDYGFDLAPVTGSGFADFVPLEDHAAYEVTIINTTGVDIDVATVAAGPGGVFIIIPDGSALPMDIIKNTNELAVRRNSGSGAVSVRYYWKR